MAATPPQALRDPAAAAMAAAELERAKAHAQRAVVQPLTRKAQAAKLKGDEPEAKRVRENYAKRTGKKPR